MHTTIAFAESNTPDGTFQKISAVSDQHIKVYGDKIYISSYNHIIGAFFAGGALALEARLVSPSLRRVNPFYIAPLELGIVPVQPIAAIFHPESPVKLDEDEALEVEYAGTAGAARQVAGIVFLAPGGVPPVKGEIWTIDATVNVAQVVNTWTFGEVTFPDSLPVGQYRVVGARVVAAGGIAFRFVPVGEANRPGGICAQDVDENDPDMQRYGGLGNWFTFRTIQPPGIELIGSAAAGAADYEIYIDVIKIG